MQAVLAKLRISHHLILFHTLEFRNGAWMFTLLSLRRSAAALVADCSIDALIIDSNNLHTSFWFSFEHQLHRTRNLIAKTAHHLMHICCTEVSECNAEMHQYTDVVHCAYLFQGTAARLSWLMAPMSTATTRRIVSMTAGGDVRTARCRPWCRGSGCKVSHRQQYPVIGEGTLTCCHAWPLCLFLALRSLTAASLCSRAQVCKMDNPIRYSA